MHRLFYLLFLVDHLARAQVRHALVRIERRGERRGEPSRDMAEAQAAAEGAGGDTGAPGGAGEPAADAPGRGRPRRRPQRKRTPLLFPSSWDRVWWRKSQAEGREEDEGWSEEARQLLVRRNKKGKEVGADEGVYGGVSLEETLGKKGEPRRRARRRRCKSKSSMARVLPAQCGHYTQQNCDGAEHPQRSNFGACKGARMMCVSRKCEKKALSPAEIKKMIDDALRDIQKTSLKARKEQETTLLAELMLRKSANEATEGLDLTMKSGVAAGAEAKKAEAHARQAVQQAADAQGSSRNAVTASKEVHKESALALADGERALAKASAAAAEATIAVGTGKNAIARSRQASQDSFAATQVARAANKRAVDAFLQGHQAFEMSTRETEALKAENVKLSREQDAASAIANGLKKLSGVDDQTAGLLVAMAHNEKLDTQQTSSIQKNVAAMKAQGDVDHNMAVSLQTTIKSQKQVILALKANSKAISHNVKSIEAGQTLSEAQQAVMDHSQEFSEHTMKAVEANDKTNAYNIKAMKENLLTDEAQLKATVKVWNGQQALLKEKNAKRLTMDAQVLKDLKKLKKFYKKNIGAIATMESAKDGALPRAPRRLLGLLLPGLLLIAGGAREQL